jgi:uncharacterized protein YecE (DUF72 family)
VAKELLETASSMPSSVQTGRTSTSSGAASIRWRTPASWGRSWRAFSVYPVAVELRHRSWSDGLRETLSLLDAFEAAFVQIDEPKFRFSIRQNHLPNVRGFYYMRLHGRNAANWWRHEKAEDRYDYLYSADELKEFTDIAGAARELVKKVYMYANNHFSAKSVANAAMIKHQLGEKVEGEYSESFVTRYPELRSVVEQRSATAERRLV